MGVKQDINRVSETGIMLPNGDIVWNEYRGHDLNTVEGRLKLLEAIKGVGVDLSFIEEELLSNYGWVTREVVYFTDKEIKKVTDESVFFIPFQEDSSGNNG